MKNSIKKKSFLLQNIEKQLQIIKPFTNKKFFGESYIGGSQSKLQYLNIKVPDVRNLFFKMKLAEQNFLDIEAVWFNSNIYEAKSLAIMWLEKQNIEFIIKNFSKIANWATEIDNWALSDSYCSILAKAFEADHKKLLPTYIKWNKHKNPWLRRISMVGTLYYSRMRKLHPSFEITISFIKPHLSAPEYYVQKAVGWTLRECYNVYQKQTLQFITTNLSVIDSDAWYAASEKMPLALKQKLVLQRRKLRLKK